MQKMKPALKKTLMAVACLSAVPAAQAAASLDRTRAIFNGEEKSMTLQIPKFKKHVPYLAQGGGRKTNKKKIPPAPKS
ncbi:molecular chaperone, partial [Escherichia coli]|nr:molecular chaperone [Escherichia coli]